MHEVLHITAAGIKDSNSSAEYSAYWRKTYDHDEIEEQKTRNKRKNTIKLICHILYH